MAGSVSSCHADGTDVRGEDLGANSTGYWEEVDRGARSPE